MDAPRDDDGKPLTGDACVSALIRAGFHVKHRGSGLVLLARAGNIVMVPDVGIIEPFMLKAILRSAKISKTELDIHLENIPSRSGFFAKSSGRQKAVDEVEPKASDTSPGRRRR